MRNLIRSSKSLTSPPFQSRKVFESARFVNPVSPRMAPSFTDQIFGLPSHSLRSLPLKIGRKALSCADDTPPSSTRRMPVSSSFIGHVPFSEEWHFKANFVSKIIRRLSRALSHPADGTVIPSLGME